MFNLSGKKRARTILPVRLLSDLRFSKGTELFANQSHLERQEENFPAQGSHQFSGGAPWALQRCSYSMGVSKSATFQSLRTQHLGPASLSCWPVPVMVMVMVMVMMMLMALPSLTVMKRPGSGQSNPPWQSSSDTCQASKDLLPHCHFPVGSRLWIDLRGKPLFSKAILLALQLQYRCLFIGPNFCVDAQRLSVLMAI